MGTQLFIEEVREKPGVRALGRAAIATESGTALREASAHYIGEGPMAFLALSQIEFDGHLHIVTNARIGEAEEPGVLSTPERRAISSI